MKTSVGYEYRDLPDLIAKSAGLFAQFIDAILSINGFKNKLGHQLVRLTRQKQ